MSATISNKSYKLKTRNSSSREFLFFKNKMNKSQFLSMNLPVQETTNSKNSNFEVGLQKTTSNLMSSLYKMLKLDTILGSAFFTALSFMVWFSPKTAISLTFIVFIHEVGHFLTLKKMDIECGKPLLTPFLGGGVKIKGTVKTAYQESIIGISGPALECTLTVILTATAYFTQNGFIATMAVLSCIIMVFNMIPIYPLDGGRVFQIFHPILWLVIGIPTMVTLSIITTSIIMIVFTVLLTFVSLYQFRDYLKNPHRNNNTDFYKSNKTQKLIISLMIVMLGATIYTCFSVNIKTIKETKTEITSII